MNTEFDSLISQAEMAKDAPTIDLHGMSRDNARHELDAFLHREFASGTRVVEIVHGRGEGSLMQEVQRLLREHELVLYSRASFEPSAVGGITYVVLRN